MTAYTASTTNATNKITATPASDTASVEIAVGEAAVESGSAATWAVGENVVTIKVTDGEAEKTYTVTVTKT